MCLLAVQEGSHLPISLPVLCFFSPVFASLIDMKWYLIVSIYISDYWWVWEYFGSIQVFPFDNCLFCYLSSFSLVFLSSFLFCRSSWWRLIWNGLLILDWESIFYNYVNFVTWCLSWMDSVKYPLFLW